MLTLTLSKPDSPSASVLALPRHSLILSVDPSRLSSSFSSPPPPHLPFLLRLSLCLSVQQMIRWTRTRRSVSVELVREYVQLRIRVRLMECRKNSRFCPEQKRPAPVVAHAKPLTCSLHPFQKNPLPIIYASYFIR